MNIIFCYITLLNTFNYVIDIKSQLNRPVLVNFQLLIFYHMKESLHLNYKIELFLPLNKMRRQV